MVVYFHLHCILIAKKVTLENMKEGIFQNTTHVGCGWSQFQYRGFAVSINHHHCHLLEYHHHSHPLVLVSR